MTDAANHDLLDKQQLSTEEQGTAQRGRAYGALSSLIKQPTAHQDVYDTVVTTLEQTKKEQPPTATMTVGVSPPRRHNIHHTPARGAQRSRSSSSDESGTTKSTAAPALPRIARRSMTDGSTSSSSTRRVSTAEAATGKRESRRKPTTHPNNSGREEKPATRRPAMERKKSTRSRRHLLGNDHMSKAIQSLPEDPMYALTMKNARVCCVLDVDVEHDPSKEKEDLLTIQQQRGSGSNLGQLSLKQLRSHLLASTSADGNDNSNVDHLQPNQLGATQA